MTIKIIVYEKSLFDITITSDKLCLTHQLAIFIKTFNITSVRLCVSRVPVHLVIFEHVLMNRPNFDSKLPAKAIEFALLVQLARP